MGRLGLLVAFVLAGCGQSGGGPECESTQDCDDAAATCQDGSCVAECEGSVCPCSEAGIRGAVSEGGGPFTFDCEFDRSVSTLAPIVIDKDVVLDGEGKLVISCCASNIFSIKGTARTVEFIGVSLRSDETAVFVEGGTDLILTRSSVSSGFIAIRANAGDVTLRSTLVANSGVGIAASKLTATNSTISGNDGEGIVANDVVLAHSTVFNNFTSLPGGNDLFLGSLTARGSIVGNCNFGRTGVNTVSTGHNIDSSDNCGFEQETDQAGVSVEELALLVLADNGGPTMTHALGAGSVAIDVIPTEDCVDADGQPLTTDQRGEPRDDGMCDVGAVEVQP